MVLDNVDDANILTAPAPNTAPIGSDNSTLPVPQIREFITTSQTGSILITSRNVEAAQMITGNCAHHLDVDEMNELEAITLLKSKLNSKVLYTEDEATELVKSVDYMPLAISQIAAHVSVGYPRFTIQIAIERVQNPSQETAQLLETNFHETNREVHRSNSIIKTWHLSFQYVRELKPSAARLLSLMCLFDRQEIPDALLKRQYGEEVTSRISRSQPRHIWWKRISCQRLPFRRARRLAQKGTGTQEQKFNFDDDWQILTNFALIKTSLDGRDFNMHRLVAICDQEMARDQWRVK